MIRQIMKILLALSSILLLGSKGNAYKVYEDRIPNGIQVPDPCRPNTYWKGVGHQAFSGGGPRNPFGRDFAANNHVWNETICKMDSDGDGKSNGEELGDPNCRWSHSSGFGPDRTSGISHPGICEPLDLPLCQSRNDFEVCKEPEKFECDAINEPKVKSTIVRGVPSKVPPEETSYYCILLDIPTDGDYHLIAHEPIIDNANVMHHMILYGCDEEDENLEKYREEPMSCFQVPDSCSEAIAGWTLGDTGSCFDGPYGFRIGEYGKKKGLLQYHWTNVEKRTDYVDSSGFKLYYTPNLRKYDAGSFTIGQTDLTIPPLQERVEQTAMCNSDCTKKLIKKPINLVSGNLHMHYLGNSGGMEMFRNGQKEQTLLWQDSYDYDTPHYENYSPPIEFKAGDAMKITCVYKSTTRENTTKFGPGTFDEMCFGFFIYYPKIVNGYCGQHGEYDICIDPDTMCRPQKFAHSDEAKEVFLTVAMSCEPDRCKPGCAEILLEQQEGHPCLRPGIDFANFIKVLYSAYDPEKATDIFQRLVSCGLKPSAKHYQPKPTDQNNAKPGQGEGMMTSSWKWQDQVAYMKAIREVACGGVSSNMAWSSWMLLMIIAVTKNF